MKSISIFLQRASLILIGLLMSLPGLFAQTKTSSNIPEIINSRHYIFRAQTVFPTTGTTRELTSEYTLRISGDSIIADLPYFGRAYSAPANLTGGGINFISLKADYSALQDKKKRWEISIKPSDVSDVQNLFLTVSENGYADLRVNNRDRQSISYRGYISGK